MTHKDFSVRAPNQQPRILAVKSASVMRDAAPIATKAHNCAYSYAQKCTVFPGVERKSHTFTKAAKCLAGIGFNQMRALRSA